MDTTKAMPCQSEGQRSKARKKKTRAKSNDGKTKDNDATGGGTRRSRAGSGSGTHRPALATTATTSLTCGISPRLFRVLDEANAPAFAVDATGHVTFWNQKLALISGLLADDVVGRSLVELVNDAKTTEVTRALEQALQDVSITVKDVEIELETPELGRNVKLVVNFTVDEEENNRNT
ncbi:kinase-regulated stress-responsive transcription factor skn7 [Phytophthora boehmeriae]|uniref:Kinase-regulated stress-responsive transcription factor skn7 n=1 Tax=Phytophthora boehmeriae TaxID=109152 RepID=A0A8T1WVP8_9STRA|nr:kinase-regulated stress-responsive transcription factor skn7 [Phytophthora boehmeriae]